MENCLYAAQGCGGCSLLATPYETQLLQKQARVDELLTPFCVTEPIIGMETPYHYRNKAILSFAPLPHSRRFASGIYAAGSHRLVPVTDCLLQDARLTEVLQKAAEVAANCHLPAWDEDREAGLLRHMVARRGVKTGEISLAVVTAEAVFPGSRDFTKAVTKACPDIVTVVQNINTRKTSAVLGDTEKVLFGKGFLTDELCGSRFQISTRAFYQVNPVQTEKLYALALEYAGLTGKETVLDAYCGIGTIALTAAKKAKSVAGVELSADAVRNARHNARMNGIENAVFACGDAGEALEGAANAGERFDVVFLDPPREGASEQFLSSLDKAAPKRAVYVSCNPETLARDLSFLKKRGWHVLRARPVDMFPHTEHVETVVLMSRVEG